MRGLKRRLSQLLAFLLTLVITLGLAEVLVPPKEVEAASRFSPPFETSIKNIGNALLVWIAPNGSMATLSEGGSQSVCWDPVNNEFVYATYESSSRSDYREFYAVITSDSRGTVRAGPIRAYSDDYNYYMRLCGVGVTSSGEIQVAFHYYDWAWDASRTWREVGWYSVYKVTGTTLTHYFTLSDRSYDDWFGPSFSQHFDYSYVANTAVMLPDGTWGFNAHRQDYSNESWFVFLRKPDGSTAYGYTISKTDLPSGTYVPLRKRHPLIIQQGEIVPTWICSGLYKVDNKPITWTDCPASGTGYVDVYFDGKLLLNGHIALRTLPSDGTYWYYKRRMEFRRVGGSTPYLLIAEVHERWEQSYETGEYELLSETRYSSLYPIVLANNRTDLQIDESGSTRTIYYTGSLSGTVKVYKWSGSGWTQISYPVSDTIHTEATYVFVVWYTANVPYMTQPISFSSGPSGSWNGDVWVQLQWGTGKTIQMYDGYALRTIATNVSTWNSDSSAGKIMPDKAYLATLPDRTATTSLLRSPNTGYSLYDQPNLLYKKMAKPSTPAPDGVTDYLGRSNYLFNVTGDHNYLISWTPHSNTDTKPPVITSLVVNDGMYSAVTYSVPVEVTATDAESGVGSIKISTDGNLWTTYVYGSAMSALLAPGDNTIIVVAVDNVGNESQPVYQRVHYSVDVSPPDVTVSGPTTTPGNSITLVVSAKDDKASAMHIQRRYQYWNGSAWAWSPWETLDDPINVAIKPEDGLYTVIIQVRDQAGNTSQVFWPVTRSSSPTGSVSSSSGVAVPESIRTKFGLNSNARLLRSNVAQITLAAPSGETTVSYSLDGVNWSPKEPVPVSARQIALPGGDGVKTLFVRFGERVPTAYEFVVDTTAPELRVWWLGGATVAPGGSATLVIEAFDNLTDPGELQISFDGGITWEPYKPSKTLVLSGSGYQPVTISVKDQAGNVTQRVLEILVN